MTIDYVIPFVDNSDSVWQSVHRKYTSDKMEQRYRDWDTLRYQLRSIEKFMPWVRNIFLVLSVGETQIPAWLNKENDKVRIVYDWEIVPKAYLPTFNSNTIDLFAPKIKDLSEHYLYGCDDYIVTRPLQKSDFFTEDGNVKLKLQRYRFERNIYSHSVVNSVKMFGYELVDRYMIGKTTYYRTIYANHTMTPHLKSENIRFMNKHKERIENSLSMFREPKNLTWLIYCLNLRTKGLLDDGSINVKLIQMKEEKDIDNIKFDDCDVIVLNDAFTGDYDRGREKLIQKMNDFLPEMSAFEKATT